MNMKQGKNPWTSFMSELKDSNNHSLGYTIIFFLFVSSYPEMRAKKRKEAEFLTTLILPDWLKVLTPLLQDCHSFLWGSFADPSGHSLWRAPAPGIRWSEQEFSPLLPFCHYQNTGLQQLALLKKAGLLKHTGIKRTTVLFQAAEKSAMGD